MELCDVLHVHGVSAVRGQEYIDAPDGVSCSCSCSRGCPELPTCRHRLPHRLPGISSGLSGDKASALPPQVWGCGSRQSSLPSTFLKEMVRFPQAQRQHLTPTGLSDLLSWASGRERGGGGQFCVCPEAVTKNPRIVVGGSARAKRKFKQGWATRKSPFPLRKKRASEKECLGKVTQACSWSTL